MQHKYPFTVLHFEIDSELLDVNVHPAKMELRIQNGEQIYEFVLKSIQDTLLNKELIPEVQIEEQNKHLKKNQEQLSVRPPEPFEKNRIERTKIEKEIIPKPIQEIQKPTQPQAEDKKLSFDLKQSQNEPSDKLPSFPETKVKETAAQMNLFEDKLLSKTSRDRHRIIGQLFDTYWLVEFQDKLFIIDQHAAHEKILYEKIMKSLKTKEFISQLMNPPLVLSLTTREEELLHKYKKYFEEIGFEIEQFGGK